MNENPMKTSFTTQLLASADYINSSLIDDDIKELFKNTSYLSHEPIIAQLVKELKKYNAKI